MAVKDASIKARILLPNHVDERHPRCVTGNRQSELKSTVLMLTLQGSEESPGTMVFLN